jgi:hypothetical protein
MGNDDGSQNAAHIRIPVENQAVWFDSVDGGHASR